MFSVRNSIFFVLLSAILITSCARESSRKTKKTLQKARALVSIEHTVQYFTQGDFGEMYIIEAQLRSLATKPIRNIVLDVTVFDKDNTVIAKRREAVTWKRDKRQEKVKGSNKKRSLVPGEERVSRIIFYAVQMEPETENEKRDRTLDKKFKKPRKVNFRTIFPDKHSISVHSVTLVD